MNAPKGFQWLRKIHRYWILPIEGVARILLILGVLLALLAGWIFNGSMMGTVFGVFLGLGFAATLIQYFLFYGMIRCPKCGHNPTKYKNGKNKPRNTACKHLHGLERCPACGDE
jgi:hypothetical protein